MEGLKQVSLKEVLVQCDSLFLYSIVRSKGQSQDHERSGPRQRLSCDGLLAPVLLSERIQPSRLLPCLNNVFLDAFNNNAGIKRISKEFYFSFHVANAISFLQLDC